MDVINKLLEAKNLWLYSDQEKLNSQIQKTIDLGFKRSDIHHQLKWIHLQFTKENLQNWIQDVNFSNKRERRVVFLHAGNLPLVGFQDVVASILSDQEYFGKLSRKDPYLLRGFLDAFEQVSNRKMTTSTDLKEFKDLKADTLVFSGSEENSIDVLNELHANRIILEDAKKIMRTAHFSIAYFNRDDASDYFDLMESVLRYDGEGCRSVKIIVAPFDLHAPGCELTDYLEDWWVRTKREKVMLNEVQKYYHSYYRSVCIDQVVWENKIVVQDNPSRLLPGFVYWIKGDINTVNELKANYGNAIQSIYSSLPESTISELELLSAAQFPDFNWKADGIDILQELISG